MTKKSRSLGEEYLMGVEPFPDDPGDFELADYGSPGWLGRFGSDWEYRFALAITVVWFVVLIGGIGVAVYIVVGRP